MKKFLILIILISSIKLFGQIDCNIECPEDNPDCKNEFCVSAGYDYCSCDEENCQCMKNNIGTIKLI